MAYERVNWENLPSTNTPVNADNLNKMVEKSDLLNLIYPVGSIYMSVNSTSPASLFGGQWEQIKDRFLLGASKTYSAGSTGGEATHTLTVDEIPSHAHQQIVTNEVTSGGFSGRADYNLDSEHIATYPQNCQTGAAGGGLPHNNMPPYLAVYMWKRIA